MMYFGQAGCSAVQRPTSLERRLSVLLALDLGSAHKSAASIPMAQASVQHRPFQARPRC